MIKIPKIHSINCVVDSKYENLYKIFLQTCVSNQYEIISHFIQINHDSESEKEFNEDNPFKTDQFKQAIKFKINKVIELIKNTPGQISIWTDIDIHFIKPIDYVCCDILKRIKYRDILISPEWKQNLNSGFFALKHNDITLLFFIKLLKDITNLNITEQPRMNNILLVQKFPILWERLPETYWNLTLDTKLNNNSIFIHANWISGFKKFSNIPLVGSYPDKKIQMLNYFINTLH